MTVTVRLFAMLREHAGVGSIEIPLVPTAGAAVAAVAASTGLGSLLADMPVAIAVNREYADGDTRLRDGDEVALIPPVSGGAEARVHAAVTSEQLSLDRLVTFVRDDSAGAIVTFLGEPRDVDALDFESYAEMAVARMTAILEDLVVEHDLVAAAAEHRTGTVPNGEPCVIVAVSAGHRPAAFAAARAAIDRIKDDVPIWKREVDDGRATWVDAPGRTATT